MQRHLDFPARLRALFVVAAALFGAGAQAAPPVEVLHWWTSGSEAQALAMIKQGLADRGYSWLDSSVEGGDDRKRQIARARQGSEELPDVLQLQGRSLVESSTLFLSLDSLARQQHWDELVPEVVRREAKLDGRWVAAPINMHRSNWIWADKRLFDANHLALPETFDEMIAVADQLQARGIRPFAFGGEAWQQDILFDDAVMSVGGARYYRDALLKMQPAALSDARMTGVFAQLARLREFNDPDSGGRPWHLASSMVVHGKAAMQFMGDWATGEFLRAGLQPGRDFACIPYPGTRNDFILVADLFAMPQRDVSREAGQRAFAATLMDPAVQRRFNLVKGSIPVRLDIPLEGFDACARRSAADLRSAQAAGTLVPRYAAEVPEPVRNAIAITVGGFFDSRQSPIEGARALARAIERTKDSLVR